MKKFLLLLCLSAGSMSVSSQQPVNDSNTPLHLMRPAYRIGYGIPDVQTVKQTLDRNDTYLETSATAIYTYCLAHAICEGWLDAKAYGPACLLGWQAVQSAVNERGQVDGVCVGTGMGFDPSFYAYRPVHAMAAHGYGPAIWAGAEVIRLLREHYPKQNDSAVQFYPEPVETDNAIFNYDGKVRF